MTSASSDGHRFMNIHNEYKEYWIYNGDGELLSKIPYGGNKQVLFSFVWSPSGEHATLTYTSDTDQVVMIRDKMEYSEYAGEQVHFFDRDGNRLAIAEDVNHDDFVEILGWLDGKGDEMAVLHWYQWEPRERNGEDYDYDLGSAVNSRYSLYHLEIKKRRRNQWVPSALYLWGMILRGGVTDYNTLPPKIMRYSHCVPLTESTRTPPLFFEYVCRSLPLPR